METIDCSKRYLVTGAAGFIGYHLSRMILEAGAAVTGIDNMNGYYDVSLKQERVSRLQCYPDFEFVLQDIVDGQGLSAIFARYHPDIVIHLAAQAGVRYSVENPEVYIQSNIVGFFNILEACRQYPAEHLIFASSSSVYGRNEKIPFSTDDQTDCPVSLYAATKKSNEVMAYSYSLLYRIPVTGLRFFTVYGPMGRPDMAYFKFADKIMSEVPIQIYNNGDMYRDFTYIDDIIRGMESILPNPPAKDEQGAIYKIYNIGNNKPEELLHFIEVLENALGKKAIKEFLPMQPGDVHRTYADISDLQNDFGFQPKTDIETGLQVFARWFLEYHNK